MKTFKVTATEKEIKDLGINPDNDPIAINDLIRSVRYKLAQDTLKACQEAAVTYGLDKMTDEDIQAEIKEVRDAQAGH